MKSLKQFFFTGCIVLALFFFANIPSASAATYAATWCNHSWPFRDSGNSYVFAHITCGIAMTYVYDVSLNKSVYLVNENVIASGTYVQAYNAWKSPTYSSSPDPLYEGSSIMARNDYNYDYRFLFGGGCASASYNSTCAGYGYVQSGFGTSGAVSFTAPPSPMNSSVTFFGERFTNYNHPPYGLAGFNPGEYGSALLAYNFPDALGNYIYGSANRENTAAYPSPLGGSYSLSNYAGYNSYYGTDPYIYNNSPMSIGITIQNGTYVPYVASSPGNGQNYIASIPYTVCASNYQSPCSATSYYTNACGQTNTSSGSFRCDGSCSVDPPPPPDNPAGYGTSCSFTSTPNACGNTNVNYGYQQCDGSCSVGMPSAPANPSGYGVACTLASSANACGQTNSSDTFTPPNSVTSVEYLVVAGGGGGGSGAPSANNGGGGGGGGVRTGTLAVTAQAYPITVGARAAPDTNGNDSIFSTITAIGGGKGGGLSPAVVAGSGGSGGGASPAMPNSGGIGMGGQGTNGANGNPNYPYQGGGGGGAGQAGNTNGTGYGGDGIESSISGTSVYYGGGGGGGADANAGIGGAGGGGNAVVYNAGRPGYDGASGGGTGQASSWTFCASENGTCSFSGTKMVRYGDHTNELWTSQSATNSIGCNNVVFGDPDLGILKQCEYSNGAAGGGGGGGASQNTSIPGGAGGSGIIIIRYTKPGSGCGSGGTITENGGYCIHTFTSTAIGCDGYTCTGTQPTAPSNATCGPSAPTLTAPYQGSNGPLSDDSVHAFDPNGYQLYAGATSPANYNLTYYFEWSKDGVNWTGDPDPPVGSWATVIPYNSPTGAGWVGSGGWAGVTHYTNYNPGTYRVRAWTVDQVGNWSSTPSSPMTVTLTEPPDLTVSAPNISPSPAIVGETETLTATISNAGGGSTGIGFTNLFQKADTYNSLTDIATNVQNIGTADNAALTGNTSASTTLSYTFLSSDANTTRYIRVCADKNAAGDTGVITESNEDNNCGPWTAVLVYPALTAACSITSSGPPAEFPGDYTSRTYTYTVTASGGGGAGSYTYSAWSGTDGLTGSAPSTTKKYTTPGTKTAAITVSSAGFQKVATCSINVQPIADLIVTPP